MLEAIIAEADLVHTQAIEGDRRNWNRWTPPSKENSRKMAGKNPEKATESPTNNHIQKLPNLNDPTHKPKQTRIRGNGKRRHSNRNGESPTKHSRTNNRTPRRETKKNENDLWRRNRQGRRKPAKNLHHHRKQRKCRRSKTSSRKK